MYTAQQPTGENRHIIAAISASRRPLHISNILGLSLNKYRAECPADSAQTGFRFPVSNYVYLRKWVKVAICLLTQMCSSQSGMSVRDMHVPVCRSQITHDVCRPGHVVYLKSASLRQLS